MLIRLRCTAVLALTTAALAGVAWVLLATPDHPAGPGNAADGVTRACTVVLSGAALWAWVTVQAGVVEAWRRTRPGARPVAPRPVGGLRRWTLAACGVAVTGAVLATPAAQASTPQVSAGIAAHAVHPGRVHPPQAAMAHPDVVVVRAGDSLWSLAAQEVQPGAGPVTVSARWRAVYRANRSVIGDDPDLIHPGQRLRLPR